MRNFDSKTVGFITDLMKGDTLENSYRKAFNLGNSVRCDEKARELRDSPEGMAIFERLSMNIQDAELTLKDHLSKLEELRDDAHANGKFAAAVQAEVARGKAAGLYTIKHELTINNEDQMSEAEIRARLMKLEKARESSFEATLLEDKTIDAEYEITRGETS